MRGALRLHCYRMLGSSHDSEDMVQETLLRAWRTRDTLEDPTRLRPWLYRIATNACLDELERRPRRVLASALGPAADPAVPYAEPPRLRISRSAYTFRVCHPPFSVPRPPFSFSVRLHA